MPDNDQYQNAPHLSGRVARTGDDGLYRDHWTSTGLPPGVNQWHRAIARQYVDHLRAGDDGAALRVLHQAKLGDPAPIDPWRLLEHVAALALGEPTRDPSAGGGEAEPVTPDPAPAGEVESEAAPVGAGR